MHLAYLDGRLEIVSPMGAEHEAGKPRRNYLLEPYRVQQRTMPMMQHPQARAFPVPSDCWGRMPDRSVPASEGVYTSHPWGL